MFAGGDTRRAARPEPPDPLAGQDIALWRILERIRGMAGDQHPTPPPKSRCAGYVTNSGPHPPVFQQASRLTGQFYISPVV